MIRCYSELRELRTFEERFLYLKLDGEVGYTTFGYDRYLNQALYTSADWKRLRDRIILRDVACDLGVDGYQIPDGFRVLIHHMNPITKEQILNRDPAVFDPENLITVTHKTHNAIHYGDDNLIRQNRIVVREANDTCPWK